MDISEEDLPAAVRRALALLTASTVHDPSARPVVESLVGELLEAPDPTGAAVMHGLGMMAVALAACELLARSSGEPLSEALADVGLLLTQRFPEAG